MRTLELNGHTVEISKDEKILFPDVGITKGDLAGYYRDIAEVLLPHLRDRALVMQRFPDGIDHEGFYHKDVPDHFPDWIRTVTLAKEDGNVRYAVADDAATLVYLADQGCITPHAWLSRVDQPDRSDMLVFDLDPENNDRQAIREAARAVRELMEEIGLAAYVKTTGSRGLHVIAPLDRVADFDTVRQFARDMAAELAARHPESLTTEQRREKRHGRIFLDTLRNAYGQTVAPPYAVRPLAGAPVATPLDWDELGGYDDISLRYTLKTILRRLGQKEDPWKTIRRHARSLKGPREQLDALLKECDDD